MLDCARRIKCLFSQEAKPRTTPPCPTFLTSESGLPFQTNDGLYNSASTRGEPARPSFDIVSEVNKVELKNAVDQANKEIANRFDFKGSDARVEQAELVLTIYADDDFKLKQVTDVLLTKIAQR